MFRTATSGRPVFRDHPTAAAAALTVGALLAMEVSDAARVRPADGDRQDDRGTTAQFAAGLAVALATTAAASADRSRWPLPHHRGRWWGGLGLTWAGAALTRIARRELGASYRPVLTVVDGHALITGGPYKVVRHPMYAGGVLIAIGAALAVDHRWASATWALPVMALVRRVGVEEAMLREALGTTYTDYARSRARLVPGVW